MNKSISIDKDTCTIN